MKGLTGVVRCGRFNGYMSELHEWSQKVERRIRKLEETLITITDYETVESMKPSTEYVIQIFDTDQWVDTFVKEKLRKKAITKLKWFRNVDAKWTGKTYRLVCRVTATIETVLRD